MSKCKKCKEEVRDCACDWEVDVPVKDGWGKENGWFSWEPEY